MTSERGFTLIELLVAMAMSVVVILGASTVVISSLDATQQVAQRTTVLGEARTGVETLLAELNSGCLVPGVSPILAGTTTNISPALASDPTDLVFVSSGGSDSATVAPVEHVVAVQNGALIDTSYPNTGGNPPSPGVASTWTFSTTPSRKVNLAEHVTTGSGPMFTYYAYSNFQTSTDSLLSASALATPLTATSAPTVAEVDLDIRFAPPGSDYNSTTTSELQDSAVFSLTAHDSSSQNVPCE